MIYYQNTQISGRNYACRTPVAASCVHILTQEASMATLLSAHGVTVPSERREYHSHNNEAAIQGRNLVAKTQQTNNRHSQAKSQSTAEVTEVTAE